MDNLVGASNLALSEGAWETLSKDLILLESFQ